MGLRVLATPVEIESQVRASTSWNINEIYERDLCRKTAITKCSSATLRHEFSVIVQSGKCGARVHAALQKLQRGFTHTAGRFFRPGSQE